MGKIVFYDYNMDKYIDAVMEHISSVINEGRNVEKIIGEISKILLKYQKKVTFLTVIEAIQSVLANIMASFLAQIPREENRKVMKVVFDMLFEAKLIEYEKIIKQQKQKELGFR